MRMTFERTGGFAGITMTKVVDTATLPDNEAKQLRHLVDAADFFRLPKTITSRSRQPDRFRYELTLEDNGKQHTVEVSEQAIPGTLRPLVDWLMAAARRK
jgi:hypothetical protein